MSTYFSQSEFACKCGRPECDALKAPAESLVIKLNSLREAVRRAVVLNSGLRCKSYNAQVGGVSESAHVDGYAADIRVSGSRERWEILSAAVKAGFRRIGVARSFIHVDVSPTNDPDVVWLYN